MSPYHIPTKRVMLKRKKKNLVLYDNVRLNLNRDHSYEHMKTRHRTQNFVSLLAMQYPMMNRGKFFRFV